jgi:hypothetical protein
MLQIIIFIILEPVHSVHTSLRLQYPGDMASVYFTCDGVQHMFVQVTHVTLDHLPETAVT